MAGDNCWTPCLWWCVSELSSSWSLSSIWSILSSYCCSCFILGPRKFRFWSTQRKRFRPLHFLDILQVLLHDKWRLWTARVMRFSATYKPHVEYNQVCQERSIFQVWFKLLKVKSLEHSQEITYSLWNPQVFHYNVKRKILS